MILYVGLELFFRNIFRTEHAFEETESGFLNFVVCNAVAEMERTDRDSG